MRTAAPVLTAIVAAAAGLGLASRASADQESLETSVADAAQGLEDAAHLLQTMDRPGAVTALDGARDAADAAVADAADPVTVTALAAQAKKAGRAVAAYRKSIDGARTVMFNPNTPDLKAAKAVAKAAKAGRGVLSILQKLPIHGVGITEAQKGSAGFHDPGDYVTVRILPGYDDFGLPCVDPPAIAVIDPYGTNSVVPGYTNKTVQPDGTITIEVQMGPSGGPARVQVSACGVTRNLLLYNYGTTGTFAPKVLVERFNGTYTGGYSGSFTLPGVGTQLVSGDVMLSVAGGVITVTAPKPGTGNVSASGGAGLSASGGGANYTFTGKFTATALGTGPGTAIAAGSWTATGGGGTGHGTWSVNR